MSDEKTPCKRAEEAVERYEQWLRARPGLPYGKAQLHGVIEAAIATAVCAAVEAEREACVTIARKHTAHGHESCAEAIGDEIEDRGTR